MKYISFERSESRLWIEVDRQRISSASDVYVTSEKYNDVIRNVVYLKQVKHHINHHNFIKYCSISTNKMSFYRKSYFKYKYINYKTIHAKKYRRLAVNLKKYSEGIVINAQKFRFPQFLYSLIYCFYFSSIAKYMSGVYVHKFSYKSYVLELHCDLLNLQQLWQFQT